MTDWRTLWRWLVYAEWPCAHCRKPIGPLTRLEVLGKAVWHWRCWMQNGSPNHSYVIDAGRSRASNGILE